VSFAMRVLFIGVDTVPSDLRKWTSVTAHHHRVLARKLERAIYVLFSDAVNRCHVLNEKTLLVALVPKRDSSRYPFFPLLYYALKLGHRYEIDLVISQDIQLVGFLALIVSRTLRKPLMVNVLGPGIFSEYSKSHFGWKIRIFEQVARLILKRAKVIRTLNPILKDFLLGEFEVSQNKIKIVSDRVDLKLFNPIRKQRKKKVIAFVGRLHPLKGIQYLLKALPTLIKEIPDIKCKIIGEGSYKERLEDFVKKLNISDHVEFTGLLPHNQMPSAYQDIDLLVNPSLAEGQSRAILEAMACGIPVIATNTGGVPSIIKHEVNGILVDPKDSEMIAKWVLQILSNDKLAKMLGDNARKVAKQYEMQQQLQKYFELFKLALTA